MAKNKDLDEIIETLGELGFTEETEELEAFAKDKIDKNTDTMIEYIKEDLIKHVVEGIPCFDSNGKLLEPIKMEEGRAREIANIAECSVKVSIESIKELDKLKKHGNFSEETLVKAFKLGQDMMIKMIHCNLSMRK